ncbi:MAG: mechanosensitive ion channel [Ignavibacteria bacterium]|nr:mechanosensitive ion channel [Ignavibacteria bacterium]
MRIRAILSIYRSVCIAIFSLVVMVGATYAQPRKPVVQPDVTVLAALPAVVVADSMRSDALRLIEPTATVKVFGRDIVTLRGNIAGVAPKQRASVAADRIVHALENMPTGVVSTKIVSDGESVFIDNTLVVFLANSDVDVSSGESLHFLTQRTSEQLQLLVVEYQEQRSLPDILLAIGLTILATVAFIILLRVLFMARGVVVKRVMHSVNQRVKVAHMRDLMSTSKMLPMVLARLVSISAYAASAVMSYIYATFVLNRFPITRPWGEGMSDAIIDVIGVIVSSIIAAVPNLAFVVVIIIVARFTQRFVAKVFDKIEDGTIQISMISVETITPTRRITAVLIWLFAIAVIYPFLPGAQSDAFKGVSVLFGLMISLGASGIVGQGMSGLILLYLRTVRTGELITVGEITGTVLKIGFFNTRIQTSFREEVTLANSVLMNSTIINHSRFQEGQVAHTTAVTIGYDTPWRQVHEMLHQAAVDCELVSTEPPPSIAQTSLRDFYVEYKMTVLLIDPLQRLEAITQLHGKIQDVFNRNGVQIMSPNYIADPASNKIVPPPAWNPGLKSSE